MGSAEGRGSSGGGQARDGRQGAQGPPALEVALRRLEEIASQLESGSLDLESSLRLYREAGELHAACVSRLAEVEREVRILTEQGSVAGEPLGAETHESGEPE